MAREFGRNQRLADQIGREVATLLQRESKDPRLNSVTVAAVTVSRDLQHARIFIAPPPEGEREEYLAVLKRATGFLRSKLAARLSVRAVPSLQFEIDSVLEHANRIEDLLSRDAARGKADDAAAEAASDAGESSAQP